MPTNSFRRRRIPRSSGQACGLDGFHRHDRRLNPRPHNGDALLPAASAWQRWRNRQHDAVRDPHATAALAEAQHRAELVEQRLSDMKAMLADMTAQRDDVKADRNRWRTQAEATQRLLSDAAARAARRWRRLAG